MNALAFLGLLIGFTCLSLAIFLFKHASNSVHTSFAFQNIVISIWGFGNAFGALSKIPQNALFWWNFALVGGFFVATLILHHTLLRVKRMHERKQRILLVISYVWAGLFPFFWIFGLAGTKVVYKFNTFYFPEPSNLIYPIYGVIWLVIAGYVTFLAVQGYIRSSREDRLPLLIYTVAYLLGVWGGGTFVFLSLFNINLLYPWGNVLIPLYACTATYTILRHQFLEIDVVIKKTIVYSSLVSLLTLFIFL